MGTGYMLRPNGFGLRANVAGRKRQSCWNVLRRLIFEFFVNIKGAIFLVPVWLKWSKQLQSIAQAGLEYSKDPFDKERFSQIRNISIQILNSYTDIDTNKIKQLFANETGYQTPKIDVRAAIFNHESKILLVKEKNDNKWSLPGGWADIDLSICENIIKEAKEEAGAEIKPKRLIAVHDRQKHIEDSLPYSVYKIFVECDFIKSQFNENIETSDHKFYTRQKLPELSIGRNTAKQINMCFDARLKKTFETLFD
jgi:ADP-ribose pyrophosphatase YjhB (NUDIX family)